MMATVGNLFSYNSAAASISATPFAVEKRNEGALKLREGWTKLTELQQRVREKELGQELMGMSQALLQNVQEAPAAEASLPELASWLQRVDDTLYGVAQLEQQLASSGSREAVPAPVTSAASALPNVWGYLGHTLKWAKVGLSERLLGQDPLKIKLQETLTNQKREWGEMQKSAVALSEENVAALKSIGEEIAGIDRLLEGYKNSVETEERQTFLERVERGEQQIEKAKRHLQREIRFRDRPIAGSAPIPRG